METKLILEIKYDCENDIGAVEMIKTEIFDNLPSVIGDGEVFINELSIETSESTPAESKPANCAIFDVSVSLLRKAYNLIPDETQHPDLPEIKKALFSK